MQQMMKNHVLHSRCAYGLRGLRLQIPREEPGDRVERDRIEIVIQVGVIGPRDDQQFLVRRIHAMLELLIRGLAEVQRMRLLAVDEQRRVLDFADVVISSIFMNGSDEVTFQPAFEFTERAW